MPDPDNPNVDSAAARLLARFTEQTAIRRLARGLAGELLLADHEGDIVDPTLDPRVFTRVPADLAPERYAYVTLLIGGDSLFSRMSRRRSSAPLARAHQRDTRLPGG